MIIYELTGGKEDHPVYQELATQNGVRHYDFLRSAVNAAVAIEARYLSQTLIKAINFHAIACLHTSAGQFRPCEVRVGTYIPPEYYRVPDLMDQFVNEVNKHWPTTDPFPMAAYILWRLNHIHPFINGNGRTARATAYFFLCVYNGGWLDGAVILPELLRQESNRQKVFNLLGLMDENWKTGKLDLEPLASLLAELLTLQFSST